MLEDESGRLRLTGNVLRTTHLVTGVIIAVLGTENANGDFEVIDIKVPDFPPQPRRWERAASDKVDSKMEPPNEKERKGSTKIAFVSGLGITGTSSDSLALELLTDYLLGYTGPSGEDEPCASRISRLIIAGNSLGDAETAHVANTDSATDGRKKPAPKKYGYDASAYNPSPITQLDSFLTEILPSIPVILMPGETDPANFSLPQQGIHRAMLPRARAYCSGSRPGDENAEPGWFDSVTNPWEGYVEGWRLWGCSGQNVDDVLRYLDFADEDGNVGSDRDDGDTRLRIMEAMLRWRCAVPTAPDTLCKASPCPTHSFSFLCEISLTKNRVLSLPNARSVHFADLSPYIFRRQPAPIQNHRGRRRIHLPSRRDGRGHARRPRPQSHPSGPSSRDPQVP